MREQPASGEREVPDVRQRDGAGAGSCGASLRVRRAARTAAGLLVVVAALALVDASRAPGQQLSARVYIELVRLYQRFGRPMLAGHVRCRYVPSCSTYSIGAVERFGIVRGLWLTMKRLASCTSEVPLGTADPVPES